MEGGRWPPWIVVFLLKSSMKKINFWVSSLLRVLLILIFLDPLCYSCCSLQFVPLHRVHSQVSNDFPAPSLTQELFQRTVLPLEYLVFCVGLLRSRFSFHRWLMWSPCKFSIFVKDFSLLHRDPPWFLFCVRLAFSLGSEHAARQSRPLRHGVPARMLCSVWVTADISKRPWFLYSRQVSLRAGFHSISPPAARPDSVRLANLTEPRLSFTNYFCLATRFPSVESARSYLNPVCVSSA
jgi:hypothetical protein